VKEIKLDNCTECQWFIEHAEGPWCGRRDLRTLTRDVKKRPPSWCPIGAEPNPRPPVERALTPPSTSTERALTHIAETLDQMEPTCDVFNDQLHRIPLVMRDAAVARIAVDVACGDMSPATARLILKHALRMTDEATEWIEEL
jgi:hypothetical protein